jgi:hypothetical protein
MKLVRRVGCVLSVLAAALPARAGDAERLVAAILGPTPLVDDLRSLTDEIGGRPTGSAANQRAIEWGLARFKAAGVPAQAEAFPMPSRWLERSASARIEGEAAFTPRVVAMPFSTATPPGGTKAPLVDGGAGADADFERLGAAARGAFVLVETPELRDIEGLFKEYYEASDVERRAFEAGVTGVVYMASRPNGLLYRHNVAITTRNTRPMLVMAREDAARALRLLRSGKRLLLTADIVLEAGGAYESQNVIAEIRGSQTPDEIVLIGAHLDSWDLGTGALDNGCNVALVIDVARQIQALGLKPRRTLRFALWNGEEQMLNGSWGYTLRHASELDKHVMTAAFDIGTGRIAGFFTNGRPELEGVLGRSLAPVAGLGPFVNTPEPIVGTDNYDFMLEGVANLVGNQEPASYGPNYHAQSDTFDKADLRQLRLNTAIAAALAWGFAEADVTWGRKSRKEIEALVEGTSLKQQMVAFDLYEDWLGGKRGRKP